MPSSNILFRTYRFCMYILALLLLLPDRLFVAIQPGLDPSWRIGLNLAHVNDFRFGRDIIFTYGPLGYLPTHMSIAVSRTQIALVDFGLLTLLVSILTHAMKQTRTYLSVFCVLLVVILVDQGMYTVSLPNVVFLVNLFFLLRYLRNDDQVSLLLIVLLAWFMFYLKHSVGLPALALTSAALAFRLIRPLRRTRIELATYSTVFLGAGPLLAVILNTDLIGYVQGGLHLTAAFGDGMAIPIKEGPFGQEFLYLALFTLLLFTLVFLSNLRHLLQDPTSVAQFFVVALALVMMFKLGFVRALSHPWFYFQAAAAIFGFLYLFSVDSLVRRRLANAFIIVLICSFPMVSNRFSLQHVEHEIASPQTYVRQLVDDVSLPIESRDLAQQTLDEHTLSLIGDGTVDVVPWEISYIYANNLSYDPRPVIQSYTAYDSYLDGKNFAKYMSDSAPDFILFNLDTIDGRHPLFGEGMTKQAILQRYVPIWNYQSKFVLLNRLTQSREMIEIVTKPAFDIEQVF